MKKDLFDDKIFENIFKDIEKDISKDKKTIFDKNKKMLCGTLANNNKKVSEESLITTMSKRITEIEKQLFDSQTVVKKLKAESEKLKDENIEIIRNTGNNCNKCQMYEDHIKLLNDHINELNIFIKENGFILLKETPVMTNIENETLKSQNESQLKTIENKIHNLSEFTGIRQTSYNNLASDDEEENESHIDRLLPKEIDINILSRRVDEINHLILKDGDNTKFEMDEDKIFRLKQVRKEIAFYFYRNGIAVEGYKFYSYTALEGKKILRDILDGYSPYILKARYPNGVILKLENKIHVDFKDSDALAPVFTTLNQPKLKKAKLSSEEFLNMLPETVVKNGKVFQIRDEIEKHLFVKRSSDYYCTEGDEHYLIDKERTDAADICKLKVQILMIDKVITVNLLKSELFVKLFDFLNKFINLNITSQFSKIKDIQNYVLYQTYPFKIYEYDNQKTFEENGLCPSSFLIFETKAKVKQN
jgi:hypothetical protein